jgi:hypothetical protein
VKDHDSATIANVSASLPGLGAPQCRRWGYGEHARSPKPRKQNNCAAADCVWFEYHNRPNGRTENRTTRIWRFTMIGQARAHPDI